MAQWNLRTQRRRPIRRELRLTTAVLPKLIQKHETLQSEIETHVAEKERLEAKVAALEKQNENLKSFRAEHGTQMVLQEPWRMARQLNVAVRAELPQGDALFSLLQAAIRGACPDDHFDDCNLARSICITGLEQIRNVRLWKNYEFRREQLQRELAGKWVSPVVSKFFACDWVQVDPLINEILVIHGTLPDTRLFLRAVYTVVSACHDCKRAQHLFPFKQRVSEQLRLKLTSLQTLALTSAWLGTRDSTARACTSLTKVARRFNIQVHPNSRWVASSSLGSCWASRILRKGPSWESRWNPSKIPTTRPRDGSTQ